MPAKDIYHDAVRRALEKDGWTITHDPLKNNRAQLIVFAPREEVIVKWIP